MTKISQLLFSMIIFCCGLILPVAATSQPAPERDYFSDSGSDPFEVSLYADTNYKNLIGSWKLSPGMRLLKIPHIAKEPKSILLGGKVAAYLFPNRNFSSFTQKRQANNYSNVIYHLRRYFRFQNSTPSITGIPDGQSGGSDSVFASPSEFSLVIHRKDIPDILGVYLISGDPKKEAPGLYTDESHGQFYSLPQQSGDTTIVYNKIPYSMEPFRLELVAGGKHLLSSAQFQSSPNANPIATISGKAASHPNAYDIEIIVDYSSGLSKKLPEKISGPPPSSWNLSQFSKGPLATLKMRYVGPFSMQHYSQQPTHKHRAPPAKPQNHATEQIFKQFGQSVAKPPHTEMMPVPHTYSPRPDNHAEILGMPPPGIETEGPRGWCCREGRVFQDRLHPCEEMGGVLFLNHEEADYHCAGHEEMPLDKHHCGDGHCAPEQGENCSTCPVDCGCAPHQVCVNDRCLEPGRCGDGHCAPEQGENCSTCPVDCGCGPHHVCVHGNCSEMEPRGFKPKTERVPKGWCCRAGEVFPDSLHSCENQGGTLFQKRHEADRHCDVVYRDPDDSRQGGTQRKEAPLDAIPITLPNPRGMYRQHPLPEPAIREGSQPHPDVLHRDAQPYPEVLPIPLPRPEHHPNVR